jgi:hypothetical protein
MDFLNRIDWLNHNGVNLGMLNDFIRNQFYDRILSRYVANQYCIDIGFGTGLLTMLALKHGAKHVQGFESDPDRYQLGCEIIKQLNLNDRIELINERYDHTYKPKSVTFTETVDGNLWWEGLWNSLPRNHETVFLPGSYFLELWALEIPESFARGICSTGQTQNCFNPGIDVDQGFISVVNSLAGKISPVEMPLTSGIVRFETHQETDWGWRPHLRAVQAGSIIASYFAKRWYENKESFVLDVPTEQWKNSTVLIVPRMGMQQDTDKIYLDTGSWGMGEHPILLVKPQANLVVTHSVRNGKITYSTDI